MSIDGQTEQHGSATAPGTPSASPSADTDISGAWQDDNQAWWDWYVSLANNDDSPLTALQDAPPLPSMDLPSDEDVAAELATPYALDDAEVAFFQENGFIKLKGVLSPGAVMKLRHELLRLLTETFGEGLDGGVQNRFLSMEMIWLDNPLIRQYVLSPRIAEICASLLAVPGVRLYHDNVLSKEPGCGRTPWHYDDHHFPLATNDVVTAWIPAQPIPLAMGPLAFAMPVSAYKLVERLTFNKTDTSYDRQVAELFRANGIAVDETPFDMGEVSFHHNLSFHTAARNRTNRSRLVLANTYYVDGARVIDSPTMVSGDWQKFMPGVGPGEVASTDRNPLCWPAGDGA
ncbi:phytanoyl-CoA dioxygenase family protein [Acuticoccus sp. MNP-M23]|uniref:phytanoyl-CoA dioxygenase family protein n=1 Tax=Acuticoccus sp. MNP-M23 TaxID=3072793 RepID=UPI0028155773|nr:phytanoyl-CoA dioxygenase family protein [Acuticoccus sp. MNP-M23]WMS44661.1 phytanoyl-CoA dioxygenase family protein [Acuticoccus sp. MNP-M23]